LRTFIPAWTCAETSDQMKPGSRSFYRLTKPLLFALCLWPFTLVLLGVFGLAGVSLGANPVEAIMDTCGVWALRLLLLTLAVTPLRAWLGWTWMLAYRRLLGLFAFFYVLMHLTTYVWLDQRFAVSAIIEDIIERPFITIGMAALLMIVPLAVTSTRGWMRRLGRGWQKLHRLVYVIAVLGVWHFYWQVKLDTVEPTIYAIILAVLLGFRLYQYRKKRARLAARLVGT
jgi:sulfoxide reductase heme-binding subunit YedZ